jgi:hypothetical protein
VEMPIKIGEDIRQQTTKCKHEFACLSDEQYDLCKVIASIASKVILTDCVDRLPCDYCIRFGTSLAVCTCPVRNELHNWFGI